MKQRKKTLRNIPSLTIPSSRGRLFYLISLPYALLLLVITVHAFVSSIEDRVYGGLIAVVFVALPATCLFGGFTIQCLRARGDYLRFTNRGIEMRIHPEFAFWKPTAIGFINWSRIEKCGVRKRLGRVPGYVLLLKLEGEKEVRQYSLQYLKWSFETREEFKLYAAKRMRRTMEEEETKKTEKTVYIGFVFFFVVLFMIIDMASLYEHTIIASWFWAVVVGICLLVAIPLRVISKLTRSAHYLLAVGVGVLLCWSLLRVNYQFADRRISASEIRHCRVAESGLHEVKNEAPRAFIRIDLGLETKGIELSPGVAHRYLDAETIDLVVYPGALGFEVW